MENFSQNIENINENKEANPKHFSYFVSGLPQEGFRESSKQLPTVDMNNIDSEIQKHVSLGNGNYLNIKKYGNGYRFIFRFLTSAKNSTRMGSCAGIDLYFEKYIPNPLTLIKAVQTALVGFKKDNYDTIPLSDGRLIINKNEFKDVVPPLVYLSTKDSKKIPSDDNIKKWFIKTFNEELKKTTHDSSTSTDSVENS